MRLPFNLLLEDVCYGQLSSNRDYTVSQHELQRNSRAMKGYVESLQ